MPRHKRDDDCYHGGAFFEAIGERFDDLARRHRVINADVLDAWFPPAPGVLAALAEHAEWMLRTSPPTGCEGMRDAIAEARGVPASSVLVGAGSSDLVFLALRQWLTHRSRALILDPSYGEYSHVLERVIGCRVDRFGLNRADGWVPDLDALGDRLERGAYDLVVLVNPNNPTGHYLTRPQVKALLDRVPDSTRAWIDEAYLEYVAEGDSVEQLASARENVVVCKSLSKVYALSGARAAYLVGAAPVIADLRRITPPWAVSLPAQVAAVHALAAHDYYAKRWRETNALRARLRGMLSRVPGVEEVTGGANFLLVHLEAGVPDAAGVIASCRAEGVYLRDLATLSARFGSRVFRTAVKNTSRNSAIASAVSRALGATHCATSFVRGCQVAGPARAVARA